LSASAAAGAEEEEEEAEDEEEAVCRTPALPGLDNPAPALFCKEPRDSMLMELARDGVEPRELSVS
jgi:hypothetical protein